MLLLYTIQNLNHDFKSTFMIKNYSLVISGRVQGVFYRNFAQTKAQELGIKGYVMNMPDGSVFIEAEGEEAILEELIKHCKIGPPKADVTGVKKQLGVIIGYNDFIIKR